MTQAETINKLIANKNNRGLIALWVGRALREAYLRHCIKSENGRYGGASMRDLTSMFRIKSLDEEEELSFDEGLKTHKSQIEQITRQLESSDIKITGILGKNLCALAKLLNLTALEQDLLGFFTLLHVHKRFENLCESFGDLTRQQLFNILALMLNVPRTKLVQVFSHGGRLHNAGLLRVDSDSTHLSRKVHLLDGFVDLISSECHEPLAMLSAYFLRSSPSQLGLDNFPHLQAQTNNVLAYLENSKGKAGINILVYGEPGTGKTQWVKAVAAHLNAPLYEIVSEDQDGDNIAPHRRIDLYKLAQCALEQQSDALLIFDEVEDVFPDDGLFSLFGGRRNTNSKAWINSLLENNAAPSFWISNSVRQIDPAYLRRFDLVIEMGVPPYSVRRSILGNIFTHLPVQENWLDELAKEASLVPAVIERAANVTKTLMPKAENANKIQEKVLSLVNATLQVQGKKEIKLKNAANQLDYSLQYLNTDANLERLVQGLQQQEQGRILLYGLPGTGKTAFGHYIAEQLDKPLLIKRASDLLSPYVGQAEKNIAQAFREAEREGAVLQIDEADSFMQSRDNAVRSWEISQVNEMLTQMEAFDGVFIASTNLMTNMDAAAMRRFDVKLEFKPLSTQQALLLFKNLFKENELSHEDLALVQQQIAQLNLLTPGDFAAVKRKFSLAYQEFKPSVVLEALREECSYKPNYAKSKGIGFMSSLNLH